MIGLDTNIIIRYLTQDDPEQARAVNALFETILTPQTPGLITLITLVEVVWVLESCYEQPTAAIEAVILGLLTTRKLQVENAAAVYLALENFSHGTADFSDALIVASARQMRCESIVTFDRKAQSVGMTMLPTV
ncbi:MAG: type II toxin-antitoxin system VapC family toxin [Gammaproteobacteria bacterium]|nr:type II toxin-antitoxin system VapC family toxin [Gammaproteobacteria bacterium]